MGKLLAFLAIIRLARKNLFVTNDLAYFASLSETKKERFLTLILNGLALGLPSIFATIKLA